jgi:hypothetical protein
MEENQNQKPKVETINVQTQNQPTPQVVAEVPEESVAIPQKSIVLFPTAILLVVVSVFAGSLLYQNRQLKNLLKINSFDECTKANGVIQESYPPVCVTKDGRRFTQEVPPEETKTPVPIIVPENSPKNEEENISTQTSSLKQTPQNKETNP